VRPPSPTAASAGDPWRLVPALGVAQIISWGSLYYGISVLGAAIGSDLGIAPAHVFGAYSAGLLLSGLTAPPAGRAIDSVGGRVVLSVGSVAAALALLWLARADSLIEYYAAWCVGGVAMGLTLYDPAFATLSQHFGTSYRKALTALTLFGGFASTVFWPLAQFGLAHWGWRATLVAFAALHVAICLPLHALLIPSRGTAVPAPAADDQRESSASRHSASSTAFRALALSFALNSFVFSAVSAHLIGMMEGGGMAASDAVLIAALIGPMQVAGRIAEITFGRNLRAASVGIIALALLLIALSVLVAGVKIGIVAALVFAGFYGLSNGVMTIVRGTVPAELFGRAGYGALLGRLAAPSLVARAAAPVALAMFAAPRDAPQGALIVLLALAALSLAAYFVAIRRPVRPAFR
jgi:hypothetical protein